MLVIRLDPPEELLPVNWDSSIPLQGMLTILYTLERLEEDGFYEECGKIIAAIKLTNSRINDTLSTRVTDEFIDEVTDTYNRMTSQDKSREDIIEIYENRFMNFLQELGYTWSTY